MAATFDLIVKGGTVVNHDGTGVRDIGVREGRIVDAKTRWPWRQQRCGKRLASCPAGQYPPLKPNRKLFDQEE